MDNIQNFDSCPNIGDLVEQLKNEFAESLKERIRDNLDKSRDCICESIDANMDGDAELASRKVEEAQQYLDNILHFFKH